MFENCKDKVTLYSLWHNQYFCSEVMQKPHASQMNVEAY